MNFVAIGALRVNPCHAEYVNVLQPTPMFILLTFSIPVVNHLSSIRLENSVYTDQLALSEAS